MMRRWQAYRNDVRDVNVEMADGHHYTERTVREVRVGASFDAADYVSARQIANERWPDYRYLGVLRVREALMMPGVGSF